MAAAATAGGFHQRFHEGKHPSFAAVADQLKHSEAYSSYSIHKLVAVASVEPATSFKRMSR